ncbi:MAG: hypothetical protein C6P37_13815 [Caldibacillus debilis]|uniref:Uncharacterized protein n=1 Tax=Caldibacillus debilis TaxID=301148 RepID=A0A3E0K0C0_9BACI|nr:MAG: hypothetical protein C6P37_13815 [Caldibacillus debilis]REJ28250.1 MAG: hypothetical protein C6W56_08320 [Caldibacillus debilis]
MQQGGDRRPSRTKKREPESGPTKGRTFRPRITSPKNAEISRIRQAAGSFPANIRSTSNIPGKAPGSGGISGTAAARPLPGRAGGLPATKPFRPLDSSFPIRQNSISVNTS